MARNTATFKAAQSRDKGKCFLITEMPAARAEKWALRALLALVQGGTEIPDDIAKAGMAGVAAMGLQGLAKLEWGVAEPLLDELMTCVQFIPDETRPHVARPLHPDDIDEVSTLLALRKEVFTLHTSFLQADPSPKSP